MPTMLTPAEVAEQLGISRNTVYDWIREGRLPAHKYGPRTIRINADDLTAFTQRVAT